MGRSKFLEGNMMIFKTIVTDGESGTQVDPEAISFVYRPAGATDRTEVPWDGVRSVSGMDAVWRVGTGQFAAMISSTARVGVMAFGWESTGTVDATDESEIEIVARTTAATP